MMSVSLAAQMSGKSDGKRKPSARSSSSPQNTALVVGLEKGMGCFAAQECTDTILLWPSGPWCRKTVLLSCA